MTLIIVPATVLRRHRFEVGRARWSRSFSGRPLGRIEGTQQALEHRFWWLAEEVFCSGGAIGSTDEVVVQGGERGELAMAEAVLSVMVQGELAVVPFHAGAAALEQIGAFAGDGLDGAAQVGVEHLSRRIGLAQWRQQLTGAFVQCMAPPRAVVPHAGICAGAAGQLAVLPR
ncbi:MAG: hypothetical protein EA400_00115 [Chromatiaceae bacterium]|nr:MAG: hypothetical protein EA400_00115 [Chromatiaceae bacterium]